MDRDRDHRLRDLHQVVVKLRNDLRFTPQTDGGRPYYVVEDTVRSKFYRIGLPEYTFISLLDGKTTIGDAIRLTAAALADDGFGDADAAGICRWLVDANLAHTAGSSKPSHLIEAATGARRRKGWQWFNPIVFRLPLLFPDSLFRRDLYRAQLTTGESMRSMKPSPIAPGKERPGVLLFLQKQHTFPTLSMAPKL